MLKGGYTSPQANLSSTSLGQAISYAEITARRLGQVYIWGSGVIYNLQLHSNEAPKTGFRLANKVKFHPSP